MQETGGSSFGFFHHALQSHHPKMNNRISKDDFLKQLKLNEEFLEAVIDGCNIKTIGALLYNGAYIDAQHSHNGYTALHYASEARNGVLCNFLIHYTQNTPIDLVNIREKNGFVPFDLLFSEEGEENKELNYIKTLNENEKKIAKLFIENKLAIDDMKVYNMPLLHHLIYSGDYDLALYAIHCGANIEMEDDQGNTPLHAAIDAGLLVMVEALLIEGANINKRNEKGLTPYDLARKSMHKNFTNDIVDYMEDFESPSSTPSITPPISTP